MKGDNDLSSTAKSNTKDASTARVQVVARPGRHHVVLSNQPPIFKIIGKTPQDRRIITRKT
jgi:hypothetical protein